MKISEIKIGTRHRRDMGDIDSLAASVTRLGCLLHPVVVNGSHELIAGERRLEAVKRLGWKDVPVTVAENLDDVAKALAAERDENECRKQFTPSEAAALAKQLEPLEKKAAKERTIEAGRLGGNGKGSVKFTDPSKGSAADRIADAVGMSRPTLVRATAIVDAAEQHPKAYGDLKEKMDATGKVNGAYKELVERQADPKNPKVKIPHKVEPEWDDDDGINPEDYPVPPGSLNDAGKSPEVILGKVVLRTWSVVNTFRTDGTLKQLIKECDKPKQKILAKHVRAVIAELEKIASKLE